MQLHTMSNLQATSKTLTAEKAPQNQHLQNIRQDYQPLQIPQSHLKQVPHPLPAPLPHPLPAPLPPQSKPRITVATQNILIKGNDGKEYTRGQTILDLGFIQIPLGPMRLIPLDPPKLNFSA
jgi:hypothetical protein